MSGAKVMIGAAKRAGRSGGAVCLGGHVATLTHPRAASTRAESAIQSAKIELRVELMKDITILDGGMSRELVRLGAELRQPEWSALALMHSPHTVQRVHEEFIAAGADVITTNSYALVPFHIGEQRFRADGRRLIALSGRLARDAADSASRANVRVAGSLPPIFGSYEPQLFRPDRAQDYLGILVEELNPYVDVFLGETLSLIAEAEAVERAVEPTGKPFWISFTLRDQTGDETRPPALRSGESVDEAARWALSSKASALLFNCSRPEVMQQAIASTARLFAEADRGIEIGVYANAFTPEDDGAANEVLRGIRKDLSGDGYLSFACDWVESGATMIGGCCGVSASHIHDLKKHLR